MLKFISFGTLVVLMLLILGTSSRVATGSQENSNFQSESSVPDCTKIFSFPDNYFDTCDCWLVHKSRNRETCSEPASPGRIQFCFENISILSPYPNFLNFSAQKEVRFFEAFSPPS